MNTMTRRILLGCTLITVLAVGIAIGQGKFGQPKSVLHIVTVKWKEGTTAEQRQKAIDGVKTLASKYPGITNVWLKPLKVQGTDAVFVMEFKDEAALKAYVDTAAQKEWYDVYIPVRGQSQTHDITN
ncbi:MAG TPA: Dabb family protein [Blastocatellia bacterium]|nr:Dabb family protein [Blastocatellia bacterium]HMV84028.1 Dabb family protein [Blastocatellia bacterium]HMZ18389.1 Dabb family protein [Blastocatellia bacterium]HNG32235.1 Dabb family protein [Blastocatellia bacterium]